MGLKEAQLYIERLHKKQGNPYLWPDFLTGLPDSKAVVKKVSEVFSKLGKVGVCYIKIANIEPYLVKYGYEKHAEIIQWAAAILKTVADEIKDTFVGKASTHEFVVITKPSNISLFLKKANSLLKRKSKSWYHPEDIQKGYLFTFEDANGNIKKAGLLKFVCGYIDKPVKTEKMDLLPTLKSLCREAEEKGKTKLVLTQNLQRLS